MVIYTNVKSVMSIIDTTSTNVNIIPSGASARNIKFEIIKERFGTVLDISSSCQDSFVNYL